MIFKTDPQAALDKARKKLSGVDENLASLRAKRAEVLLTAEDAGSVVAVDQAIEAELRNAEIYKDRIKALQEECRKAEYQTREDRRKKAIAKISARLRKREELASKLQAALTTVGPLYSELMALGGDLELERPFGRPGPGFSTIDRRSVDKEVSWLVYGLVHEHRLPEPSSAGLGVVGIRAKGIDGAVREQNEAIVSRLEMVPIADDLLEEAI
jgi:multidrug efflux pump subunit AcrA (membrane-fusion protein)